MWTATPALLGGLLAAHGGVRAGHHVVQLSPHGLGQSCDTGQVEVARLRRHF